jgi:hypothetical protein
MALPKAETRTDLSKVRAAYVFADEDEVTARLHEYPFLVPLLEEARDRLTAYFGPDAPVRIDLACDPAGEDRSLFARVITDLPVDESLDRLDKFDWEWWLEAGRASQNLLHFDVE